MPDDFVQARGVSVDVALLIDHPKTALLSVLKLLGHGWETCIEDEITVEQFSGAMTNMVYRCGLLQRGKEAQVVLMRVHASSSDLFDRQAELETFRGVSQAGLGPRLLLLFGNGRVEEFLSQHVTLAAADIHDPAVSMAVAATMATFHARLSKVLSGSKHHQGLVQLWDRLRHWLDLTQQLASKSELQQLGMTDLEQEITQLEQQLSCQHPCWVALCHNDLQYGNIMALAAAAELIGGGAAPTEVLAPYGPDAGSAGLAQQLDSLVLRQHRQHAAAGGGGSQQQAKHSAADGASDDGASLSNVSVAGSTTPSVSGLSVLSAAGGTAAGAAAAGAAGNPRVAQLATSDSGKSLQLLSRSPSSRTVQLPDGSLVLPGMKARVRGQSPEPARGKRPGNSDAGTSRGGSVTSSSGHGHGRGHGGAAQHAAATGGGGAAVGHGGDGGAALAVMMQRPSVAAVRRHAHGGDDGDGLLLQLGHDDAEMAADAALARRRRLSHNNAAAAADSDDGGSSTSSAADSAEADDLVLPQLLSVQQRRRPGAGGSSSSSSRVAAAVEREQGMHGAVVDLAGGAADSEAARSKTARRFQELRKARRTPAAGFEFPTLAMSDASDEAGGGSSDSSGLSDDDSPPARGGRWGGPSGPARGRSPPSSSNRSPVPAALASPGKPPASAAAAASSRAAAAAVAVAGRASPAGSSASAAAAAAEGAAVAAGCLTFIDYEYSGFNPVAFDIANHWCEWAADYHTEEPAVLDFSRLPDEQQRRAFVEAYLRALLGSLGVQLPPEAVAPAAHGDGGGASGSAAAATTGSSPAAGAVQPPGGRSEAAWSALSSRGGSVLSMPDTEAAWETASQSSVVTSRSGRGAGDAALGRGGLDVDDVEGGGGGPGGAALSDAAAAEGGLRGADARPCTAQLRDVWYWLELAVRPAGGSSVRSSGGGGGVQLDSAAWRQLVAGMVAAAQAYMAASHLQWALWGVIQAKVSDVDFDFAGYGQQRWRQYLATRPSAAAAARRQQQ